MELKASLSLHLEEISIKNYKYGNWNPYYYIYLFIRLV